MNLNLEGLKISREKSTDCECQYPECDADVRMVGVYTVAGFDGYVEACRKHARECMVDAITEDCEGRFFEVTPEGGLVERTFRIEMFTREGWVPCEFADVDGQRRDTRRLPFGVAQRLHSTLVVQRDALGCSGDLEGETRVTEEPPSN